MPIKRNFVFYERTFKVIYEEALQLFRTLLGFRRSAGNRDQWKNNGSAGLKSGAQVQSAILVL